MGNHTELLSKSGSPLAIRRAAGGNLSVFAVTEKIANTMIPLGFANDSATTTKTKFSSKILVLPSWGETLGGNLSVIAVTEKFANKMILLGFALSLIHI